MRSSSAPLLPLDTTLLLSLSGMTFPGPSMPILGDGGILGTGGRPPDVSLRFILLGVLAPPSVSLPLDPIRLDAAAREEAGNGGAPIPAVASEV